MTANPFFREYAREACGAHGAPDPGWVAPLPCRCVEILAALEKAVAELRLDGVFMARRLSDTIRERDDARASNGDFAFLSRCHGEVIRERDEARASMERMAKERDSARVALMRARDRLAAKDVLSAAERHTLGLLDEACTEAEVANAYRELRAEVIAERARGVCSGCGKPTPHPVQLECGHGG